MKKIGTSILFLLFTLTGFANGPSMIKGTLEWSKETQFIPAEDSKTIFISHFNGAAYDEIYAERVIMVKEIIGKLQ